MACGLLYIIWLVHRVCDWLAVGYFSDFSIDKEQKAFQVPKYERIPRETDIVKAFKNRMKAFKDYAPCIGT